jgi:hypothetical protein
VRAPPRLPKDHPGYPKFEEKGSGDDMEKVLGQMSDQGLKGKVWSRDELMKQFTEELQDDGSQEEL